MPPAANATPLDGFYYGALAAVALYNLAVFARLRDRTHLLFVGMVVSFTLASLAWDGLALRSLWPGAASWNRTSLVALDAAAALFATLFARRFLHTQRDSPRLDPFLRAVVVLAASAILLSVPATWALGFELTGLVSLVAPPTLLAAGIVAWRAGFAPARPYLLAHACLLTGVCVEVAAGIAEPAGLAWARHGTSVGALTMAGLLSHGLAVRHREGVLERGRLEARRRELENASQHDALTELWSRRRLDEVLQQIWRRALREDGVVSLLLADIDCFEPFNGRHRCTAGDACLRRVAHALAGVAGLRPEDLVARFGGDRFAVVLPGLPGSAALQVADAMRSAVAELGIPHAGSSAADHVTVSVGVGTCVPDEELEPKRLLDAADEALHAAKRDGRNCVRWLGE